MIIKHCLSEVSALLSVVLGCCRDELVHSAILLRPQRIIDFSLFWRQEIQSVVVCALH